MSSAEIGTIIAFNLKRIREERHLSLGQLAESAGVSKVILSQIEKGDSNPTVNTIWKITTALQLPYTSLLELPEGHAEHVRKQDIGVIDDHGIRVYNYYSRTQSNHYELYLIELDPGCIHESIGHPANSKEYLLVTKGTLILESAGVRNVLKTEDALRFDAAGPHTYRNETDAVAAAVMGISYD